MHHLKLPRRRSFPVLASTLLWPWLCAAEAVGSDTDALPTIVVTGTRSEKTLDETPVRTEVVDRKEIERTTRAR